jgi:CheY-like chemotaxis protein
MRTLLNRLDHLKVLLVDDSRDGLLVRKSLLEDAGCHVDTAANGEEALKLFAHRNFDVVVTDFRMPHMNGRELIRMIRSQKPDAPVILLSGFVEFAGLTEQNTGADLVLEKCSSEQTSLIRAIGRLARRGLVRKPPASVASSSARATSQNLSH